MWGAVIGDIAGSRFEGSRGGPKSFELFHQDCRYTDDTVCTAAVADIIVNDHRPDSTLQAWCRRHPGRGYGGHFRKWIASTAPAPYGSFGNGAAMRVAPVAFLYRGRSLEEALATSDRVTEITHDHPEGIKGARAVTEAIWLASQGEGPETLRREIMTRYGYDLGRSLEAIRPSHRFDVTCQGTVPTALICALARLRQLGPLTDDNLLIFRDRTPKGRHYTERPGDPLTGLQDSSFGAGCFGNAKSS